MITDDNYYEPCLEDMFIGYECEICSPTGYKQGKFPEICRENKELDEFGEDDLMRAAHAILRTPYLTTEQLKSEGWTIAAPDEKYPILRKIVGKHRYYEMLLDTNNHTVTIQYINLYPYLGYSTDDTLFSGKCPSINEFRFISKLIGL